MRPTNSVRVIPDSKLQPGKHPLKITDHQAYRVIHKVIGVLPDGTLDIETTHQPIPGLSQYVLWYTDGSFVGLGAEWDELQPHH